MIRGETCCVDTIWPWRLSLFLFLLCLLGLDICLPLLLPCILIRNVLLRQRSSKA